MDTPRTRALDTAIDLVASEGLRSLTHARVDERAGIPRGSTSNYFRTRDSLLTGVADRIVERELAQVREPILPDSAADLVDILCGLVELVTGPSRALTTARLVVFMEASHNVELQERVSVGRTAMESSLVSTLSRLGARAPHTAASTVMACAEGLILHRIARHDRTDPRATLELVVNAALA